MFVQLTASDMYTISKLRTFQKMAGGDKSYISF